MGAGVAGDAGAAAVVRVDREAAGFLPVAHMVERPSLLAGGRAQDGVPGLIEVAPLDVREARQRVISIELAVCRGNEVLLVEAVGRRRIAVGELGDVRLAADLVVPHPGCPGPGLVMKPGTARLNTNGAWL